MTGYDDLAEDPEPDELRITATHEAGHFVMAVMVGGMPRSVSIAPGGGRYGARSAGHCGGGNGGFVAYGRVCDAMWAIAGEVAVDALLGIDTDPEALESDYRTAEHALAPLADPDKAWGLADDLARRIIGFARVRGAITDVADWLQATTTPTQEELAAMYNRTHDRIGFLRRRVYGWIEERLGEEAHTLYLTGYGLGDP